MNYLKIFILASIAVLVTACGAREEKTNKKNNADEVVVVNMNDLDYPNSNEYAPDSSKTEFEFTESSTDELKDEGTEVNLDESKTSETTETSESDEIKVNSDVDKKTETKTETKTTTKEENIMVETKEGLKSEKEAPLISKEIKKSTAKRYYVIAGSFQKFDNAENLNAFFKKDGYLPLILGKINGYNRVAVSSYVEEANARSAIKKLRTKYAEKKIDFWLLLK